MQSINNIKNNILYNKELEKINDINLNIVSLENLSLIIKEYFLNQIYKKEFKYIFNYLKTLNNPYNLKVIYALFLLDKFDINNQVFLSIYWNQNKSKKDIINFLIKYNFIIKKLSLNNRIDIINMLSGYGFFNNELEFNFLLKNLKHKSIIKLYCNKFLK